MLTNIIIITTISILSCKTPIKRGIHVLLISLLILCVLHKTTSIILRFLIFLIYISGLLILFFYITSLDQKNRLPSSMSHIKLIMVALLLILTIKPTTTLTWQRLKITQTAQIWTFINSFNYLLNVRILLFALLLLFNILLAKNTKTMRKIKYCFNSILWILHLFYTKEKY